MRFTFPSLAAPFAFATALLLAGCSDNETGSPFHNQEIDMTPPATPTGLAVSATETTLVVEWADNSEADLAGYLLEKSEDRGNTWSEVGGLLLSSSFEDAYAAHADYRVRAKDFTGNESANSPILTYLAPTGHGPKTPSNPE